MFDEIEFEKINRLPKYVFAAVNDLKMEDVITSYSIHYTKLYEGTYDGQVAIYFRLHAHYLRYYLLRNNFV